MSQTLRRNLTFVIALAASLGGLLFAVPIFIVAGPLVEPHMFAVVRDARILSVAREGDSVVYDVIASKARSCTYLGSSALAGPRAGLMEAAQLTFPESVNRDASRPTGLQAFGVWRVEPVHTGELVLIQIRHRCHSFWDTTTQLGPWRVPPGSIDYPEGLKP
jgi:ABC-type phosphate/phosphonate transport system permease subunit